MSTSNYSTLVDYVVNDLSVVKKDTFDTAPSSNGSSCGSESTGRTCVSADMVTNPKMRSESRKTYVRSSSANLYKTMKNMGMKKLKKKTMRYSKGTRLPSPPPPSRSELPPLS
mmetsp:Transcript_24944/g.33052  ORF Transcript_24944/g.33052 Transcript_24944/m.33052 type:complete len:113 (+) Transcript_24944:2-340(+)